MSEENVNKLTTDFVSKIIEVRASSDFPTNFSEQDEDVNVYMAHLMACQMTKEYHDMAKPYLTDDPKEVVKWVKETTDNMIRYFVFKVNADHILFNSSVVQNVKYIGANKIRYQEIAKLYYDQAFAYATRLYVRRKSRSVPKSIQKISASYEAYRNIMTAMSDYWHKIDSEQTDSRIGSFENEFNCYYKREKTDEVLDKFLEAQKSGSKEELEKIKKELKHLSTPS